VHDDAPLEKVAEGLKKNGLDPMTVTIVAGGLRAEAFDGVDLIVLSPGVPRAHPALAAALPRIPCINELELGYAELARGPAGADGLVVLAITGTNGKSTTTTMAGAIARVRDPGAFIGGNLGTPLCAAIVDGLVAGTAAEPRLLVIELSSYQLETIWSLPVDAAAFTNLTPDHLDRYPSVDAYYQAKARLFALLKTGGGVTLNARDAETRRCLWPAVPGHVVPCHFDVLPGEIGVEVATDALQFQRATQPPLKLMLGNPRIVGHHNRQNAAAAAALGALIGLDGATIQAGLDAYAGIAHRLERVGTHAGVTWWNDSKATNVDAAVTALHSFATIADGQGVHLIAGGLGKGAPYAPLVDASRGRVVAVYTIGADAPAIAQAYAGVVEVIDCGDLQRAAGEAARRARKGQHIVLSPACASFDQFRDYGHRGDEFRTRFAEHSSIDGDDAASSMRGSR
jgi:UDP-N-acetylmuramoylalanine--D-glutamate ligase